MAPHMAHITEAILAVGMLDWNRRYSRTLDSAFGHDLVLVHVTTVDTVLV